MTRDLAFVQDIVHGQILCFGEFSEVREVVWDFGSSDIGRNERIIEW